MAPRQDRVELKGSARVAFPSGQDVGPADPNQQIEVSVLLRRGSKPGDFPAAGQMGSRLPGARKYLTREEFAKQYGASPADIEKVRAFAKQYGLRVSSEDRASRTVKLNGTVQASTTHSERASAVTNTLQAHIAAAPAPSRFPLTSTASSKASSAWTIALKPSRIFVCARKTPAPRLAPQTFLTRRFKWRKPTHSLQARTALANVSP